MKNKRILSILITVLIILSSVSYTSAAELENQLNDFDSVELAETIEEMEPSESNISTESSEEVDFSSDESDSFIESKENSQMDETGNEMISEDETEDLVMSEEPEEDFYFKVFYGENQELGNGFEKFSDAVKAINNAKIKRAYKIVVGSLEAAPEKIAMPGANYCSKLTIDGEDAGTKIKFIGDLQFVCDTYVTNIDFKKYVLKNNQLEAADKTATKVTVNNATLYLQNSVSIDGYVSFVGSGSKSEVDLREITSFKTSLKASDVEIRNTIAGVSNISILRLPNNKDFYIKEYTLPNAKSAVVPVFKVKQLYVGANSHVRIGSKTQSKDVAATADYIELSGNSTGTGESRLSIYGTLTVKDVIAPEKSVLACKGKLTISSSVGKGNNRGGGEFKITTTTNNSNVTTSNLVFNGKDSKDRQGNITKAFYGEIPYAITLCTCESNFDFRQIGVTNGLQIMSGAAVDPTLISVTSGGTLFDGDVSKPNTYIIEKNGNDIRYKKSNAVVCGVKVAGSTAYFTNYDVALKYISTLNNKNADYEILFNNTSAKNAGEYSFAKALTLPSACKSVLLKPMSEADEYFTINCDSANIGVNLTLERIVLNATKNFSASKALTLDGSTLDVNGQIKLNNLVTKDVDRDWGVKQNTIKTYKNKNNQTQLNIQGKIEGVACAKPLLIKTDLNSNNISVVSQVDTRGVRFIAINTKFKLFDAKLASMHLVEVNCNDVAINNANLFKYGGAVYYTNDSNIMNSMVNILTASEKEISMAGRDKVGTNTPDFDQSTVEINNRNSKADNYLVSLQKNNTDLKLTDKNPYGQATFPKSGTFNRITYAVPASRLAGTTDKCTFTYTGKASVVGDVEFKNIRFNCVKSTTVNTQSSPVFALSKNGSTNTSYISFYSCGFNQDNKIDSMTGVRGVSNYSCDSMTELSFVKPTTVTKIDYNRDDNFWN